MLPLEEGVRKSKPLVFQVVSADKIQATSTMADGRKVRPPSAAGWSLFLAASAKPQAAAAALAHNARFLIHSKSFRILFLKVHSRTRHASRVRLLQKEERGPLRSLSRSLSLSLSLSRSLSLSLTISLSSASPLRGAERGCSLEDMLPHIL